MASYHWVESSTFKELPSNAVVAGNDRDGQPLYIGTTEYNGDELPVKIIPGRREAYVSYNGQEIRVSNYKVLVRNELRWERSSNGSVPHGAVPGGRTVRGETLYIGRVLVHGSTYSVGKVHPSHGCVYVPYDGTEMTFKDYEVLIQK